MPGLVLVSLLFATPPGVTLSAGYFGEFATHPGAFVAGERVFLEEGPHALVLSGRLAGYHHFEHHTGLFLRAELGYRLTAKVGFFADLLLGMGVHQRWLAGPVYTAGSEGLDPGQFTAMPGATLGLGWHFPRAPLWPDRVCLRADGWLRTPVNGGWLPGFAVSLGFGWTFGRGAP